MKKKKWSYEKIGSGYRPVDIPSSPLLRLSFLPPPLSLFSLSLSLSPLFCSHTTHAHPRTYNTHSSCDSPSSTKISSTKRGTKQSAAEPSNETGNFGDRVIPSAIRQGDFFICCLDPFANFLKDNDKRERKYSCAYRTNDAVSSRRRRPCCYRVSLYPIDLWIQGEPTLSDSWSEVHTKTGAPWHKTSRVVA